MANKIYSFINTPLPSQTQNQAYGDINSSTYRVTSLFDLSNISSNQSRCACAVVDGTIFIQPQEGSTPGSFSSTLVNVVLKPSSLSISGLGIKYFIYRGIKKDSLVDGSLTLKSVSSLSISIPSQNEENVYIGKIKKHYEDFHGSAASLSVIDTRVMGWSRMGNSGNNYNSDMLLDSVFYKKEVDSSGEAIELGPILGGDIIGIFNQAEVGFEVVLDDYSSSDITLHEVRKPVNILDVSSLSSGDEKRIREKVHSYLDPITFYLMIKKITGNIYSTNRFNTSTADVVFSTFQTDFVDKFYTNGRVYIDLRNELDCSLNYCGDNIDSNGKSIQLSINSQSANLIAYNKSSWPVYYFTYTPNSGNYFMPVEFSFLKTYNPVPVVYADVALNIAGNFIEDVGERFIADTTDEDLWQFSTSTWSTFFKFYLLVENGILQSWLIKLNVNRRHVPSTIPNTAYKRDFYLDNVFGPIVDIGKYKVLADDGTQWTINMGKRYINALEDPDIRCEFMLEAGVAISETTIKFSAVTSCSSGSTNSKYQIKNIAGKKSADSVTMKYSLNTDLDNLQVYSQEVEVDNSTYQVAVPIGRFTAEKFGGEFSLGLQIDNEFTEIYNYAYANLRSSGYNCYINFRDTEKSIPDDPLIFSLPVAKIHAGGVNGSGSFEDQANVILTGNKQITATSFDGWMFTTSAYVDAEVAEMNGTIENLNLIDVNDMIDIIKVIEFTYTDFYDPGTYFNVKARIPHVKFNNPNAGQIVDINYRLTGPDDFLKIAKRLRVHWFGNIDRQGTGTAYAFRLVPEGGPFSYYDEEIYEQASSGTSKRFRAVYERELVFAKQAEGKNAYDRLFYKRDAYLKADEPHSTGVTDYIDFGHLVFGFEALCISSSSIIAYPTDISSYFTTSNDKYYIGNLGANTGINEFYKKWNIYHPLDLAALIGDLGSVGAEYFHKHYIDPYGDAVNPVLLNDLMAKFNSLANKPDLLSDIDSVGIWHAHQFLLANNNSPTEIRFSDIITLYYRGKAYLRSGLTKNDVSSVPFYTVRHRWLIFCRYMGFIDYQSGSTTAYDWKPVLSSVTPATYWLAMRQQWYLRMYYFMQLWAGRLVTDMKFPYRGNWHTGYRYFDKVTAPRVFADFFPAWEQEDQNNSYTLSSYPNPFVSNNAYSKKVMELAGVIFEDIFLDGYVKPRLDNECNGSVDPTNIVIDFTP